MYIVPEGSCFKCKYIIYMWSRLEQRIALSLMQWSKSHALVQTTAALKLKEFRAVTGKTSLARYTLATSAAITP